MSTETTSAPTSEFKSLGQARKAAKEWLEVATKVYHYRRDVLAEEDLRELTRLRSDLKQLIKNRTKDLPAYDAVIEPLQVLLKKIGGYFFPRDSIADWVETLVVMAIIGLGARQFFYQPMKIPTNSMYPTYNGMTTQIYESAEEIPSGAWGIIRKLARGTEAFTLKAPASGEIIWVEPPQGEVLPGRSMLVIPQQMKRLTLVVDGQAVEVRVPVEFDTSRLEKHLNKPGARMTTYNGQRAVATGTRVQAGETMLAFEILTGDQLFVDRWSYHFFKPQVGDPVVFDTTQIPGMVESEKGKYYIKRLVGVAGDTIEIRPPAIIRNGAPIEGAEAFTRNAAQDGEYEGYLRGDNRIYMGAITRFPGDAFTVTEGYNFVMGDNSDQSHDSRFWGFVPERSMVGKAALIYWPISPHVGPAE